nr:hypothetical protein CFP56_73782 [Quercus suber]
MGGGPIGSVPSIACRRHRAMERQVSAKLKSVQGSRGLARVGILAGSQNHSTNPQKASMHISHLLSRKIAIFSLRTARFHNRAPAHRNTLVLTREWRGSGVQGSG